MLNKILTNFRQVKSNTPQQKFNEKSYSKIQSNSIKQPRYSHQSSQPDSLKKPISQQSNEPKKVFEDLTVQILNRYDESQKQKDQNSHQNNFKSKQECNQDSKENYIYNYNSKNNYTSGSTETYQSLKFSLSQANLNSNSQTPIQMKSNPNCQNCQAQLEQIKQLSQKITSLLKEVNSLSKICNNLMDDNNNYKTQFLQMKEKQEKLYTEKQIQQSELKDIQNKQLIDNLQKQEEKIQQYLKEINFWRNQYDELKKGQDQLIQQVKEDLQAKHESELQSFKKELRRTSKQQQQSQQQIGKNHNQHSNAKHFLQEDWLEKYLDLKDEHEKVEKSLNKKITSLEEQNNFLVEENQQLKTSLNENINQLQDRKKTNFDDLNDYFSKFLDDNPQFKIDSQQNKQFQHV